MNQELAAGFSSQQLQDDFDLVQILSRHSICEFEHLTASNMSSADRATYLGRAMTPLLGRDDGVEKASQTGLTEYEAAWQGNRISESLMTDSTILGGVDLQPPEDSLCKCFSSGEHGFQI